MQEHVPKVEFKIIATEPTEKPSDCVAQVLTIPTYKFALQRDQVKTLAETCELEDDSCRLYVTEGSIPHEVLRQIAVRVYED